MDFLVGSVRRHFSGSRSKSRSLPLYTKAGPGPSLASTGTGSNGDSPAQATYTSPLEKRISCSSPKLSWSSQRDHHLQQQSKRRNSNSCLAGQRSDSDASPSDTTSCSSLEFLPASSYRVPVQEPSEQGPRASSANRRERLEALKARVTAKRNKYKNDSSSSSSDGEQDLSERRTVLPRFHSDEALHRAGRGRSSRRLKRRSQDLEALSRTRVTRSDPQLPFENRPPVTWKESSAYMEPRRQQSDDSPSQSASEDVPVASSVRKPDPVCPLPPQTKHSFRKPLTVSVHGLAGHFPPASPCDSGLGTHSMTSSPSLGRAPTPPLRSPKTEGPRLPPSLSSTSQAESSTAVWLRKKQHLLSSRSEVGASPRPAGRVYAYTDQAPHPSTYLSDSQVERGRNHSEDFSRKLGVWKAMESANGRAANSNGDVPKSPRPWSENREAKTSEEQLTETCRSRSVVWPKDFSNGVSRSPVIESSPRNSPLAWTRKEVVPSPPVRTFTPLSARTATESESATPKTSPVPPRIWSPSVQPRNPNRISAAEALGVTAAIPVPPTRVGSLDTARRNMDALVDRERRRRCSEHLEDALQELEAIYQSLKLNEDDELLDRAERRDMPQWRPRGQWQKRYSIADPTGGFPLARSFSDQPSRLRRSTVPDKVADDLAVRKLQQRPPPPKVNVETPSYLLCSPAYTPSLSVPPAVRDVTVPNEPDPELDDVGYRKFVQSHRHQLAPHPPFGIPLEPSPSSPSTGYIHASDTRVPDWRTSKKKAEPDPLIDDLAYRNLRRESLLRSKAGSRRSISALSDLEDWTRPCPSVGNDQDDSMTSILAALESLGNPRSPPPVPKRRSVPSSGQKRLHGLTLRA